MKLSPKFLAVLRNLLFVAVGIATAFALFIAVENWRGARAWNATARDLTARGEPIDHAALQPPRVPDAENFFKTPLLAKILYDLPNDPARNEVLASTRLNSFGELTGFRTREGRDFAWLRERMRQTHHRDMPATDSPAADVLTAMRPLQHLLDEVREAARTRPLAALAPRETPISPPWVDGQTMHVLGSALTVQAAAELELGQPADAAADLLAGQRLATALAGRPETLLNVLVAIAIHGAVSEIVSVGCRQQAWTEAQLLRFSQNGEALQPLARFRDAFRSERAQVFYALDITPTVPGMRPTWPAWLFSGWAQQNKVHYSRRLDSEVLALIHFSPDRISLNPAPPTIRPPKPSFLSYSSIADLSLNNIAPILISLGEKIDQQQLASLSWAIERYRLVHGRAPASLDELVPTILPQLPKGIFDGQSLRMSTGPKGEPRLYSLGKNGRDEGGEGDDIVFPKPDRS